MSIRHLCKLTVAALADTVGKLLGHVNVASTAHYAHLADDTLMAAAEVGAAELNVNW